MKTRTKEEINEKISKGEAKVLTAEELKDMIKNSEIRGCISPTACHPLPTGCIIG